MPNRTRSRVNTSHAKARLLPMAKDKAADLVLHSRLQLERLRSCSIDHRLINHMARLCMICEYIARAGYGELPQERFDTVEKALAQTLFDFDATGVWSKPESTFLEDLTDVINEYDRMLSTVRLDLFAKASDYLDRLTVTVASSGSSEV
ncbi:conserved hypothetical protein [Paraburkholderia tropica]|uniref:hypothetical protein n=1 Tax=Paraburkholderia tropica TaxID=92647 RepID=UPI001CB05B95|nr:hypothetical protein [Paraburkholderia tropica]CAG9238500.1 conserved hypothetical protein [Paraburkholderia tropica]